MAPSYTGPWFASTSPWNTAIPSTWASHVHGDNTSMTTGKFVDSSSNIHAFAYYISGQGWLAPGCEENIIFSPAGTPNITVWYDNADTGVYKAASFQIPMPQNWTGYNETYDYNGTNRYERRTTVVCENGDLWVLYQPTPPGHRAQYWTQIDPTYWHANEIQKLSVGWTGDDPTWTGGGSGLPHFVGIITPYDYVNTPNGGHFNHALALNTPVAADGTYTGPNGTHPKLVYPGNPATKPNTDGRTSGAVGIPHGARMFLDPTLTDTDLNSLGVTKEWQLKIARTMQVYGAVSKESMTGQGNANGLICESIESIAWNAAHGPSYYAGFQWPWIADGTTDNTDLDSSYFNAALPAALVPTTSSHWKVINWNDNLPGITVPNTGGGGGGGGGGSGGTPLKTNNFNGGTDATTITTGNSGGTSGDAFNTVNIATGAVVQYSASAAFEGSLGMRVGLRGTNGNAAPAWNAASLGSLSDSYDRFYFQFTALPAANGTIFSWLDTADVNDVFLELTTGGNLRIVANGTGIATSSTTLSANTWYRIETHMHADTSATGVAFLEVRIFTSPNSTTYAESFGSSNTFSWNTVINQIWPGLQFNGTNWPSATDYIEYDAIGVGASTWIGPIATASAPANTVLPAISGSTVVGSTLTTTNGTWTDSGSPTFTYQWARDSTGNGIYSGITGATSSTYSLVDADDGCHLICVVTDTDSVGSTPASSSPVGPVTEPAPTNSVVPALSGAAQVQQTLSTNTGTWAHMGGHSPSFTYQWQTSTNGTSGWANISGQTNPFYLIPSAQSAQYLRCVVTATNDGGSASANSSVLGPVTTTAAIIDTSNFQQVCGPTSPSLLIELDYQNDPTSATQTWTDITRYVVSYSRQPVRMNEFDQPGPATASITLRNDNSWFSPDNTSSPFYGGLKKYRRIRVRALWGGVVYNRFWGYVVDWPQSWDEAGHNQTVQLQLVDNLFPLATLDLQGQSFASKVTGAAIADVLTSAGVGSYTLDTGNSTVVSSGVLPIQSYALQRLQDIASSENGFVYADGAGVVNFHDRHRRITGGASVTVQGTIGDGNGEIPYTNPQPQYGDVWPVVQVTPNGGTVQVATNSAGEASYFQQTLNFPTGGTYLVSDPAEALQAANYLVTRYSNPVTRISSVTLIGAASPSLWPTILSLDTSDKVIFKRRLLEGESVAYGGGVYGGGPYAGGGTISLAEFVEGYGEDVTVGQDWRVTVPLSPADIQTYWVLGDATYGQLGNTTRFSY